MNNSEASKRIEETRSNKSGGTMNKHFNRTTLQLTIDGTEYEYEVRYINNRAVAIGYRADLSGADLAFANLRWADLTDAVLNGAKLRWADLTGANLADAKLRGVDLTRASLLGANFRGADLTDAVLTEVYELSTVKGKPASLPEGWEYTEGKGIHKAAPQDSEPTCAHVQHGKFCSDCGVAL